MLITISGTAVSPAQPQPSPAGDRLQLLTNPSFTGNVDERKFPEGWVGAFRPAHSRGLQFGVVQDDDARKAAWVKQEGTEPGVFNHWAQSISAPPPESRVTLEVEVSTDQVKGQGGVAGIVFRAQDGRELSAVWSAPQYVLRGDVDWTVMKVSGSVPPGCARLDVRAGLTPESSGSIYFRSLRLYHERAGPGAPLPSTTVRSPAAPVPESSTSAASISPSQAPAPPALQPPAPLPDGSRQLLANADFRRTDAAGAPLQWFCTILKTSSRNARSGLSTDADGPYVYLTQQGAADGTFNNWSQRVAAPPAGSAVQLRADVATRDADPGAQVRLEFFRTDGSLIHTVSSAGAFDLGATRSWQTVVLEAVVPPDCGWMVVRLGLLPVPGTGTLYVRRVGLFVLP